MSSNGKNVLILGGVIVPASLAAIAYLWATDSSDDSLRLALRLTARLSYMMYLLVFVARPLRQLVAGTATGWLLRERRSIGIAFAAMHSVHLGLIAYRFSVVPGLEYAVIDAVFGGTAYLLLYLMLITSFDAPARALGAKNWRLLHKIGLYYIGFIFVATLLPEAGEPVYRLERTWFVVLTGLALFIRLTAYFATRRKKAAP